MKHLKISMAGCALCLLLTGVATAQEAAQGVAVATEDWEQLRAQAKALRQKADRMRGDAQATHDATAKACWEKFLVSDCQQDAKVVLRKVEREAQQVDLEALAIERRVAAHERTLKQAKKREKAEKEDAKAAQRAEKIRLEDEKRLAREAAKAGTAGR